MEYCTLSLSQDGHGFYHPACCQWAKAGRSFAFVSMLADLWAGFWTCSVFHRDRTYPGNAQAHLIPLVLSVGELRQPSTLWLWQMFLSVTLGHLALFSCIQRVIPGTLPSATRNEYNPREYCQVILEAAFWKPSGHHVNALLFLFQELLAGQTHLNIVLLYVTVFPICALFLSNFVCTLHFPPCVFVVTGEISWTEAICCMSVSLAKYQWESMLSEYIVVQPNIELPKQ